jgi:PAS domain S-box-containing protein
VIGAIESVRDITDKKVAKDSLQREREFFDAVIDGIPNSFFIVDREGRIVRSNTFVEESLGMSGDAIRDTNILSFVIEEDRPAVTRALAEVFSRGTGQIRARVKGRRNLIRQYLLNGRRMDIGNDSYVVGTGVDITDENYG